MIERKGNKELSFGTRTKEGRVRAVRMEWIFIIIITLVGIALATLEELQKPCSALSLGGGERRGRQRLGCLPEANRVLAEVGCWGGGGRKRGDASWF